MQCNGNFKQWFNIFLIPSEAWQGYESKAYGVSNHNLKLQSRKLSRTRDNPNFPTQGWADTAFCTRKRSETYTFSETRISFTLLIQNTNITPKCAPFSNFDLNWYFISVIFHRSAVNMI